MDSSKRWTLKYEVDALKMQLTLQMPISEPTIRQTFLRILTLLDEVIMDGEEEEWNTKV